METNIENPTSPTQFPNMEIEFWTLFHQGLFTAEQEMEMGVFLEKSIDEPCDNALKAFKYSQLGALYVLTRHINHRNIPRGLELCNKAAKLNNIHAMIHLAYIYRHGLGVPKDYVKSMDLYKKAAELGDTYALSNIVEMYKDKYITEEPTIVIAWCKKAAALGDTNAMLHIGYLYQNRYDRVKAKHWYMKAARLNDTSAMYKLGSLYEKLDDVAHSMMWYEKAAKMGNSEARNSIEKIQKNKKNIDILVRCRQTWSLPESKTELKKLKKEFPYEGCVQYHCTMVLKPKDIFDSNKTLPYFLNDTLISDEEKRKLLNTINPNLLNNAGRADFYFSCSQLFKDLQQDYCQKTLENISLALDKDDEVPNCSDRFYYFMALQCEANGELQEAIIHCLDILDYAPACHLLANILFLNNELGIPDRERYLLCLYLLEEETLSETIGLRINLINKLLCLLEGGKGFGTIQEPENLLNAYLETEEITIKNGFKHLKFTVSLWQLFNPKASLGGDGLSIRLNKLIEESNISKSILTYWKEVLDHHLTQTISNKRMYHLCQVLLKLLKSKLDTPTVSLGMFASSEKMQETNDKKRKGDEMQDVQETTYKKTKF